MHIFAFGKWVIISFNRLKSPVALIFKEVLYCLNIGKFCFALKLVYITNFAWGTFLNKLDHIVPQISRVYSIFLLFFLRFGKNFIERYGFVVPVHAPYIVNLGLVAVLTE